MITTPKLSWIVPLHLTEISSEKRVHFHFQNWTGNRLLQVLLATHEPPSQDEQTDWCLCTCMLCCHVWWNVPLLYVLTIQYIYFCEQLLTKDYLSVRVLMLFSAFKAEYSETPYKLQITSKWSLFDFLKLLMKFA